MKYQVSFHAKTWYLHMWKYHRCYGCMINHAFHTKKLFKWNGLVFHWCLYNKWNITWPLGDTKFLFSCWKNISFVCCTHSRNIFSTLEEKFHISAQPCNISYIRYRSKLNSGKFFNLGWFSISFMNNNIRARRPRKLVTNLQQATKSVKTLRQNGAFWCFTDFKRGK